MKHRITITEHYTYSIYVDTDDVDDIVRDTPILIDRDKDDIETLKNDDRTEFEFSQEYIDYDIDNN